MKILEKRFEKRFFLQKDFMKIPGEERGNLLLRTNQEFLETPNRLQYERAYNESIMMHHRTFIGIQTQYERENKKKYLQACLDQCSLPL